MTTEDINASLHRSIKSGYEYDHLFPSSSGKVVKLAQGNTKVAIKEMAKWAKKYAHQVKDLAPLFVKSTLSETINTIQWFMYWHYHYAIDGENQNLKSPSAAWSERAIGMDCKSYSITVSCILLQLGIKHALRRIKQDFQSNAFTHVYVMIPNNQTTGKIPANAEFLKDYLIIDGTIEHNNELPFREKDDIIMKPESSLPIFGLAHPGLSCGGVENFTHPSVPQIYGGIKPVRVKTHDMALRSPLDSGVAYQDNQVLEAAFAKFYSFLDDLESQGLPKQAVNKVIDHLKYFINAGIEPTLGELFGVAYFPNGLGLAPVAAPVAKKLIPTALKFLKQFGPMLEKIIPKDLFTKTFGAVFANGFNLSCWNSTYTPAKVAQHVQEVHVPFYEMAISSVTNTTNTKDLETHLNYLLKAVDTTYIMYAKYMVNGANWRACSKEAIQIYVDIVTGAKVQTDMMLKQLEKEYDIQITENIGEAKFTFPQAYTGAPDFSKSETQHGKAKYRQVKFKTRFEDLLQDDPTPIEEVPGAVSTFVDAEGYTNYVDGAGNVVKTEKIQKPQKAGFGIFGALIVAGIVAGAVIKSKKEESK